MAEPKKPTDADMREAFGDKAEIVPPFVSEARIREIVQEEVAKALATVKSPDPMKGWQHDAGHGATQDSVKAQTTRDTDAGVAVE